MAYGCILYTYKHVCLATITKCIDFEETVRITEIIIAADRENVYNEKNMYSTGNDKASDNARCDKAVPYLRFAVSTTIGL